MKDLNVVLERFNQNVTRMLESNRKIQYQQIHSLRKRIISKWQKNESVTGYELDRTFQDLYSNIKQDIDEIINLCNKTIRTFGISEEGRKLQLEAICIQENCQKELDADKKKLQKLRSGWKTVLAGYEDEGHQE